MRVQKRAMVGLLACALIAAQARAFPLAGSLGSASADAGTGSDNAFLLQMGLWQSPVSPNEEIYSFIDHLKWKRPPQDIMPRGADGTVDCRPVRGFRATRLCVFNYAIIMNATLGRASAFAERRDAVLSDQDHLEAVRNRNAEGHNLGTSTLARFWQAFSRIRANASLPADEFDRDYLRVEGEFWDGVLLPWLQGSQDAYLAAVAVDANYRESVPHELLHALYFENPRMRQAVSSYWEMRLNESERNEVRRALSFDYDPENEELMRNEFQAYVLSPGSRRNPLASLAANHRDALTQALLRLGIDPSLSLPPQCHCSLTNR